MNYCAQNHLADEFWDQINEISFEVRNGNNNYYYPVNDLYSFATLLKQ